MKNNNITFTDICDREIQKRYESIVLNPAYKDNPLLYDYKTLLEDYKRLNHRMNKIVKISDSFQAKLRDMNLLLEKTAKTDMLTGLANRRDALMKLDIEKTRSERYKRCFSILLLDIDNFKKVNDQYGHEAGDFILVELAKEMLRSVRREDTCARWGGEEFLMILPETSLDGAFNLGNKLREKVESLQFNYNRILLTITISIGVTEYFINEVIDECIRRADLALYRAKSEGRNCVIAF